MKTRLTRWILAVALVGAFAVCAGGADKGPLQQAGKSADAKKGGGEEKGPLELAAKAAEAKKGEPLVIRMYNVQDLLQGKDYPYRSFVVPPTSISGYDVGLAAETGGGGAGLFAGREAAVGDQASMTSALTPAVIEELIRRVVDPESWEESGGRGRIERVGALLVVTQTADNQKKVAELLEQFRTERQLVTFQALWVLLDDAQVSKLIPEAGAKRTLPIEVTPAALAAAEARVIYRGNLTSYDRQMVHLASGRAQTLVVDMEPVVAEAAVGWDLNVTAILWGALLEITPCLSPDAKSATLNIHSMISEGKDVKTRTTSASTGSPGNEKGEGASMMGAVAKGEIDLPEFLIHTFRTTIRVPLDKAILIGGMTSPTAADGKVLYLILEISASK